MTFTDADRRDLAPSPSHQPLDLNVVDRTLAKVASTDADLIYTQGDRVKVIGAGLSVVLTAALETVMLPTALSLVFGGWHWGYVPVGLAWGLLIFNIDRWVVAPKRAFDLPTDGMTAWQKFRRGAASGITGPVGLIARAVLAVVIAFTLSEPVLWVVVADEIKVQVHDDNVARATQEVFAEPKWNNDLANLTTIQKNTASDVVTKQREADAADKARDDEINGTGGTRVPGCSPPICTDKIAFAAKAEAALVAAKTAATTALTNLNNYKANLTSRQQAEIDAKVTAYDDGRTGPIAKMTALSRASKHNSSANLAVWFIRLAFLLLELIPLLMKVTSSQGLSDHFRKVKESAILRQKTAELEAPAIRAEAETKAATAAHAESVVRLAVSRQRAVDEAALVDDDLYQREHRKRHTEGVTALGQADTVEFLPDRRTSDRVATTGVHGTTPTDATGPSDADSADASADDAQPWNVNDSDPSTEPTGTDAVGAFTEPEAATSEDRVIGRWKKHELISHRPGVEVWTATDSHHLMAGWWAVKIIDDPDREYIDEPIAVFKKPFTDFIPVPVEATRDQYREKVFFATEYFPSTLHKRIEANDLTLGEVVRFGVQLHQAMSAAIARLLVHGDIKPPNIGLTGGARPDIRILDWGLASGVNAAGQQVVAETGYSLYYAPYEQLHGTMTGNGDWRQPAADIYGIGATMYHMLTGYPPLQLEAYWQHLTDNNLYPADQQAERRIREMSRICPPRLFTDFVVETDPDAVEPLRPVSELLDRMLSPDPQDRGIPGAPELDSHGRAASAWQRIYDDLEANYPHLLDMPVGMDHVEVPSLIAIRNSHMLNQPTVYLDPPDGSDDEAA